MRRWQRLSRLFHHDASRKEGRCILIVERLEEREVPAVVITDPTAFPFAYESTPFTAAILVTISGDGFFSVFNSNPYEEGGQTYTATLTAPQGRLFINTDAAAASGISISQNGTSAVTLTGSLYAIDDLLRDQAFLPETETRIPNDIQFFPNMNFSGDALVRLSVTDPETGSPVTKDSYVHVEPVPSPVIINVNASGEVFAPASGFPLGNGFLTIADWVDDDGSEQILLNLSLSQPNLTGFTLIGKDGIINPVEGGAWQLKGSNPAEFSQLLNSLVLIPRAGFTGRVTLNVSGFLFDSASFPFSGTNLAQEPRYLLAPPIALRFFQGGNVTLPPTFGQEGGTIDLGGRYVASDPDELPGDIHTLTLSVPNGTLTLNSVAIPAGVSAGRNVAADGSTTIVLQGTISAINQFLATPGCMTYTAANPTFAGAVPLTVVLAIQPGPPPPPTETGGGTSFLAAAPSEGQDPNSAALPPDMGPASRESFTGVVALSFIPIASHVFPSALDAVTNENTPVAVSIALTTLADLDGSESVLIILGGVPDGATFNHGTNLGGGQWVFSAADLLGLIFTPPPGTNGIYTFNVIAVVTDATSVGSDSAAETTSFTITVLESDDDTTTPTPNTTDTSDTSTSSFLPEDSDDDTDTSANNRFDRDDSGGNGENIEDGERDDSDRGGDRSGGGRDTGRTLFAGTGGGGGGPGGPGMPDALAGRPRFYSPTSGSPFVQTEMAQAIYAGGEKHPLPPVLPLDQTLPVAGFSDSGGDSFALIDKIYRDANAQPVAETVSVSLKLDAEIGEVKQAETVAIANTISTSPTDTPGVASGETPAEVREGEWRMWAVATTIASAVVAWVWLSRRTSWSPVRAIRRLFRIFYRRTPERAV